MWSGILWSPFDWFFTFALMLFSNLDIVQFKLTTVYIIFVHTTLIVVVKTIIECRQNGER